MASVIPSSALLGELRAGGISVVGQAACESGPEAPLSLSGNGSFGEAGAGAVQPGRGDGGGNGGEEEPPSSLPPFDATQYAFFSEGGGGGALEEELGGLGDEGEEDDEGGGRFVGLGDELELEGLGGGIEDELDGPRVGGGPASSGGLTSDGGGGGGGEWDVGPLASGAQAGALREPAEAVAAERQSDAGLQKDLVADDLAGMMSRVALVGTDQHASLGGSNDSAWLSSGGPLWQEGAAPLPAAPLMMTAAAAGGGGAPAAPGFPPMPHHLHLHAQQQQQQQLQHQLLLLQKDQQGRIQQQAVPGPAHFSAAADKASSNPVALAMQAPFPPFPSTGLIPAAAGVVGFSAPPLHTALQTTPAAVFAPAPLPIPASKSAATAAAAAAAAAAKAAGVAPLVAIPAPPPSSSEQQQQQHQPQLPYHQKQHIAAGAFGGGAAAGGGPVGRATYMSVEEVQSIVRMHWVAAHGKDPYVDDYYHQARRHKLAVVSGQPPRHFAPSSLSHPQLTAMLQAGGTFDGLILPQQQQGHASAPVAFLPIEGLGRVPVPSIRRPRPLLDVDSLALSGAGGVAETGADGQQQQQTKQAVRALEEEPLLAARIAVEDGMAMLLDVDDIDRLLCLPRLLPHPQQYPADVHAAMVLRQRRHALLESLAASLQLAEPMANPASPMARLHDIPLYCRTGGGSIIAAGPGGGLGAFFPQIPMPQAAWRAGLKEDNVFIHITSLAKGRKFLARFLRLMPPASAIERRVVLAVFRHLPRLFPPQQVSSSSSAVVGGGDAAAGSGLATAMAHAAAHLSLATSAACLAAFSLAPEHPPLCPVGNLGDSTSIILRALLDGAAVVRRDPSLPPPLALAWQTAFDAFFVRVSHSLCFDAILAALPLPPAAAAAVSKEMPLELIRAALPHTNQQQRERVGALLHGLLHSGNV